MGCEKCHATGIDKNSGTYCECGYGKNRKSQDLLSKSNKNCDIVKRFNDFDLKK